MTHASFEEKCFIVLLALVSIAFVWLMLPFYGAVFWGVVLAIIFQPVQRFLESRMQGRAGLAAFATLVIILFIVILPVTLLTGALVQEGANFYERTSTGDMDMGRYLEQVMNAIPAPAQDLLNRFGLGDISGIQEQLSVGAMAASQFLATKRSALVRILSASSSASRSCCTSCSSCSETAKRWRDTSAVRSRSARYTSSIC